ARFPGPKEASTRDDRRLLPGEFQRVVVPVAAVLETDYGQLVTRLQVRVHPYAPGLDSTDHPVRAAEIPGPYARREAERAIVGDRQRLLLGVERDRHRDRPEDLLLAYPRRVVGGGEQRRLYPVATGQCGADKLGPV